MGEFGMFGLNHHLFYYLLLPVLGETPLSGIATWPLERNAAHVITSDAHDDKHRKPIMSEARDVVSLVLENPAAIIAGLSLSSSRETSRDTSQKLLAKIG